MKIFVDQDSPAYLHVVAENLRDAFNLGITAYQINKMKYGKCAVNLKPVNTLPVINKLNKNTDVWLSFYIG
uniref:Uncharacterized protein n=1 Tax=viral metagenome TaxID=1070528 RepID=A0A6H2A4R3_9ZZZZ